MNQRRRQLIVGGAGSYLPGLLDDFPSFAVLGFNLEPAPNRYGATAKHNNNGNYYHNLFESAHSGSSFQ
jgi:hypothetical protein